MGPGGKRRRISAQSESVPNLGEQDGSSSSTSKKDKGGRKKSQNLILTNHLRKGGQKPTIHIPHGLKRPLGNWSQQWITEVAIIARKHLPLTAHSWRQVTVAKRKSIYDIILKSFDVDFSQRHVVVATNSFLKERFKDYRHELYIEYLKLPDDIIKCEHPPEYVSQSDWESLYKWWEGEIFQKMSKQNTTNRGKLTINHLGGSKSFVRHRDEKRDPETNEERDRISFYKDMHYSLEKGWIAPEAEHNYDKMVEMDSQPPLENSTPLTRDEISDKVLGVRPGYVRGLGNGLVAPSRRVGVEVEYEGNHQEMDELKKRAEEAERQHEELRIQHEELRSEHEELRAWKEESQETAKTQQSQIDYLMSMIKGGSFHLSGQNV